MAKRPWLPWITVIALILVVGGLGYRILADGWDRERITDHFHRQGHTVQNITWQLFARWWSRGSDRTYLVEYLAADGQPRRVYCRTGLFDGVYISEE